VNSALDKYKAKASPLAEPGELITDRGFSRESKAKFTATPQGSPMSERDALESMHQFWIPGRAPDGPRASEAARVRRKLQTVDSNLDLAFNAHNGTYAVFERASAIRLEWCRGWRFLFDCRPFELDNRVMAAVYMADTSRRGGAKKCFEQVEAQKKRDAYKVEEEASAESKVWAGDYWRSTQPFVGGGNRATVNANKMLTD